MLLGRASLTIQCAIVAIVATISRVFISEGERALVTYGTIVVASPLETHELIKVALHLRMPDQQRTILVKTVSFANGLNNEHLHQQYVYEESDQSTMFLCGGRGSQGRDLPLTHCLRAQQE